MLYSTTVMFTFAPRVFVPCSSKPFLGPREQGRFLGLCVNVVLLVGMVGRKTWPGLGLGVSHYAFLPLDRPF